MSEAVSPISSDILPVEELNAGITLGLFFSVSPSSSASLPVFQEILEIRKVGGRVMGSWISHRRFEGSNVEFQLRPPRTTSNRLVPAARILSQLVIPHQGMPRRVLPIYRHCGSAGSLPEGAAVNWTAFVTYVSCMHGRWKNLSLEKAKMG